MTLTTRKPTGAVPFPVVLVEGDEKSGKTYSAALLSASEKVGRTFWLDLGEGAADEYGAIPGVRYEIVEHDGTYGQILAAILEVKEEAARAKAAGEPPTVLVIDSMTDVWEGLKNWASERARGSDKNKAKLRQDPNAEVDVTMNLWNDANARHRRIITALLTFPGIVVMTARGKETAEMDGNKPSGNKLWKVEGQKNLAFDATVWLRLSRSDRPIVIGARSVHVGLVPGRDEPKPITADPDNLLEWLIFDVLKVDPGTAHARDLKAVTGGELTEDEKADELSRPPESEPAQRRGKNKNQPPPADAWTAPPVTDQAWLEEWLKKVDDAAADDALTALYAEAGAKVRDGQLTPADADLAKTAVATRHEALAKQAKDKGWSDVEVAKVPNESEPAA